MSITQATTVHCDQCPTRLELGAVPTRSAAKAAAARLGWLRLIGADQRRRDLCPACIDARMAQAGRERSEVLPPRRRAAAAARWITRRDKARRRLEVAR